jgi:hypothetical protein
MLGPVERFLRRERVLCQKAPARDNQRTQVRLGRDKELLVNTRT